MSSVTVDQSTGRKSKGDDSFDIEGMVFPLLKLIVTTRPASRTKILCSHKQQKDDLLQDIDEVTVQNELLAKGDQDGCETPKSEEHKIPKVEPMAWEIFRFVYWFGLYDKFANNMIATL